MFGAHSKPPIKIFGNTSHKGRSCYCVVKYFRNNHFASSKYKSEGGKGLLMPYDVRWNTLADCLEIYITEWQKLLKICEEYPDKIDYKIFQKVSDIDLKRQTEDFQKILKPTAVTLDKMQRNDAFLSDAVEAWKELEQIFEETNVNLRQLGIFKKTL